MPDNQTTEGRDGLHCVYGKCRGIPYSAMPCNPGCSFTMNHTPTLEGFAQQLAAQQEPLGEPFATVLRQVSYAE